MMNKYVKLIVEDYLDKYEKGSGILGFTRKQVEEIKLELEKPESNISEAVSGFLRTLKFNK
jgi:hypothetical protein